MHAISEITNLQTTLDSKSDTGHTHKVSDITDLSIDLTGVASIDHIHSISEVTNLQTTLDGKAASSHTHAISDITNYKSELSDLIYPLGCVYSLVSTTSTSPAIIFGGTWTLLDKTAIDSIYVNEATPVYRWQRTA